MDASEILEDEYMEHVESVVTLKRERLFGIISGGMSKQYLGKELTIAELEKMNDTQVSKLYCRYEARLGAKMTKTIGNSLINLYVLGVTKYFNVPDPPKFLKDLEEDPFINNALNSVCCELYYKYGMYLAPFTALLTTAQHISFKDIPVKLSEELSEELRELIDEPENNLIKNE